MIIDKAQVKRILVITLSNAGDIILTTPAICALAREFPEARIDVMVGPAGKEIFSRDPRIFKVIIYDKHLPITEKRRLQQKLKKLQYDLVADFRNTLFGLLIGPRYRTATVQRFPKKIIHSMDKHLYRLRSLGIIEAGRKSYIFIPKEDEEYTARLLKECGIDNKSYVVVNPGAKSHLKRWTAEGFAAVCDRLIRECASSVVLIGLKEDRVVIESVMKKMKERPHNLAEKTNIRQLAALLKGAKLLVTNDSAPLHLGCAVGVKVLALFGPTDPRKYGPTGEFDIVMNERLSCAPCERAACKHNYECMKLILPDKVFEAAKMMLEGYE